MAKKKTLQSKLGETMNTDELAEYLDMNAGTLRNWRSAGKGPKFVKIGGYRNAHVIYKLKDVKAWEKSFL
jgi:hypothetical protein